MRDHVHSDEVYEIVRYDHAGELADVVDQALRLADAALVADQKGCETYENPRWVEKGIGLRHTGGMRR